MAPPPPSSHFSTRPTLTYREIVRSKALSHLADSEYVHAGYRHKEGLYPSLLSLFTLHNESANIWTHLLGLVWTLYTIHSLVGGGSSSGTVKAGPSSPCPDAPLWPLLVFLSGAALCFLCSTLFHTLLPVSPRIHAYLNVVDYIGISTLIFTSMVPPLFYTFSASHPHLRDTYLALSLLTNGVCMLLGMAPHFRAPAWRAYRAGAYVFCGASGVVPLLHHLYEARAVGGEEWVLAVGVAAGVLSMGAQYIVGAIFYALRLPESFAPGRFDVFGSHAIFHCLVVSAVVTHFNTVVYLWEHRLAQLGCGGMVHH